MNKTLLAAVSLALVGVIGASLVQPTRVEGFSTWWSNKLDLYSSECNQEKLLTLTEQYNQIAEKAAAKEKLAYSRSMDISEVMEHCGFGEVLTDELTEDPMEAELAQLALANTATTAAASVTATTTPTPTPTATATPTPTPAAAIAATPATSLQLWNIVDSQGQGIKGVQLLDVNGLDPTMYFAVKRPSDGKSLVKTGLGLGKVILGWGENSGATPIAVLMPDGDRIRLAYMTYWLQFSADGSISATTDAPNSSFVLA